MCVKHHQEAASGRKKVDAVRWLLRETRCYCTHSNRSELTDFLKTESGPNMGARSAQERNGTRWHALSINV